MRIFLAVRQGSMRRALKTLFGTRPGLEVIGEAADERELISQVKSEAPDILLIDEGLAEKLVEDVIVPLQQIEPELAVIVLGRQADLGMAYLDAGAVAFISKSDSPLSLLTAIEEVRLERRRV